MEITVDFIENLRQSKELFNFNTLETKKITFNAPIISTAESTIIKYMLRISEIDAICRNFPFDKLNMVLAGGVLQKLSTHQFTIDTDIDIFVIGRENALERVIEGLKFINPNYIYVSKNCITAYCVGRTFQFILKWYESIIDILNDFDLGSSMIAYDGFNFYTNAEGKFAYETGYNIINLKKCRYSYTSRIIKYIDRGFGLLHTELAEKNNFKLDYYINEFAYGTSVHYDNPKLIEIHNLNNLISGKNHFCMPTTIDEIGTGIVQLRLTNPFDPRELKLDLLEKYFTNEEIKKIIDTRQISMEKFDTSGKQIKIEVLEGSIYKLSTPDMTPEEFYGEDYIYFGQFIKSIRI